MDLPALLITSFIAAFLGTLVMTVSQEIEIRINKRPISYTPALAVFKILHINFHILSQRAEIFWSYAVHFLYGTFWGFPLAFFYLYDFINFIPVVVTFFLIVLLQGWIVLPFLGIVGPPWTWGTKAILTEVFHKSVYALATVAFFLFLL